MRVTCVSDSEVDFLLLLVRVRRAHQDPKDVVDPEEVPSVHFLFLIVTFTLTSYPSWWNVGKLYFYSRIHSLISQ